MKLVCCLLAVLVLGGCGYDRVRDAYKEGNPHARHLLEDCGLSYVMVERNLVDYHFLELALKGDENAMKIVEAQIAHNSGISSRDSHYIAPFIINKGGRR